MNMVMNGMRSPIMPGRAMPADITLAIGSGREYKGFGLGSASLLENRRYTNTCELKQYLRDGSEEQKKNFQSRISGKKHFS